MPFEYDLRVTTEKGDTVWCRGGKHKFRAFAQRDLDTLDRIIDLIAEHTPESKESPATAQIKAETCGNSPCDYCANETCMARDEWEFHCGFVGRKLQLMNSAVAAGTINMDDIGRCCSCKRDPCPTPKRKRLRPSQGCNRWTKDRKIQRDGGEHGHDTL